MDIQKIQERLIQSTEFDKMTFILRLCHALTGAMRAIQINDDHGEKEKLEGLKWLNEVQHRIVSYLLEHHLGRVECTEHELVTVAYHIAINNQTAKEPIMWALKTAQLEQWK